MEAEAGEPRRLEATSRGGKSSSWSVAVSYTHLDVYKRQVINISTLAWTQSDHTNRSFHVSSKIAGEISTEFKAISDVLQGSNLRPLLFILFINGIKKIHSVEDLNPADDLKLCAKVENYEEIVDLKNDAENMYKRSVANRMPLNLDKAVVMAYSRKTV